MSNKQKVLIVDDNSNNIRLAADTLKNMDVSIAFATSGFKALEIIKDQTIDLVLMDINMPEMDGFETTKKIDKSIPVIFVTALDDKDSVLRAFSEGGLDYITKPFHPAELKARVATHLKLSKLNKNLAEEVEEKTKELKDSLFIDHVTGAYNASKLYHDLENSNKTVAAMIHIKELEHYEIAFGLERVEKVLFSFVEWLNTQSEFNMTVYSISFSDFICLFETDNIEEIERCCNFIQSQLEKVDMDIVDSMINLNAIITVAKGDKEQLVQHLRISQLEAKNKNLNYYLFEEAGMNIIKEQEKNIFWMDFLKKSFKNDTIVPFFQPIVESKTGKIIKYECLARIKDEDKIISPFFFIEAAKKLGAVTKITRIMIEKSCQVFSGSKMGLSINITKEDLMEEYLLELLDKTTKKYDIKKDQITLEILEEISVFGNNKLIDELLKLKKDGYKIALDDFGSENASFSRMLDLKVDILKIDAAFIKNIHTHKNSRLIVEGIIHIAKLFDYDVVAEYVHNEEVLKVINELGIEYSQGYHFSPPLEKPEQI